VLYDARRRTTRCCGRCCRIRAVAGPAGRRPGAGHRPRAGRAATSGSWPPPACSICVRPASTRWPNREGRCRSSGSSDSPVPRRDGPSGTGGPRGAHPPPADGRGVARLRGRRRDLPRQRVTGTGSAPLGVLAHSGALGVAPLQLAPR
jgi:hypothetical protein